MGAEENGPRVTRLDFPVASLALLSHELRTPLTPPLGYLDALLEGEAGQLTIAQRDYLDRAPKREATRSRRRRDCVRRERRRRAG